MHSTICQPSTTGSSLLLLMDPQGQKAPVNLSLQSNLGQFSSGGMGQGRGGGSAAVLANEC